jgi:quercetin dioxygenase-like cupin family protein
MTSSRTAEEIRVGPIEVRFLVEADATSGTATLFEFDVPPGTPVPPPHSHDRYEETLYGLRGTLTWTVDGLATAVGPGEALCIPHGTVHRFENPGTEVATQLAVVTPGLLGADYFRELAAVVDATEGPPDLGAMLAVMRRHGLTPAVEQR